MAYQEQDLTVWVFHLGVALTLFIAVISAVDAILLFYVSITYLLGHFTLAANPEWRTTLEKLDSSSVSFLLLNLYNIIIWCSVLVCAIGLLSFKTWCLRSLCFLLGFDMFFTVFNLLYETLTGTIQIYDKSWFITLNVIQVSAILIFSHPNVAAWVEIMAKSKQDHSGTS